jgi:hypothetical protein
VRGEKGRIADQSGKEVLILISNLQNMGITYSGKRVAIHFSFYSIFFAICPISLRGGGMAWASAFPLVHHYRAVLAWGAQPASHAIPGH